MTNREIIWEQRVHLAEQGRIGYSGREVKVTTMNCGEMIIREPDEIHTYAAWKQMGFQVKKGEKAVAKFTIWKYASKTTETETGDEEETGKMFMKLAFFFSPAQVEKIA